MIERFSISREARGVVPVAGVVCVLLAVGFMLLTCRLVGFELLAACPRAITIIAAFWGVAAFVTWGFIVWFFRIPIRPLLADDSVVFSPCDGRVVIVKPTTESEVTGEGRIQISIFMSITNVHQNLFPVGGRVTYFRHHNGHFHVAWHPKASEKNEHTTWAVASPRGTVVFRQIAGFVARRIVSYARAGSSVIQNTPCGFIKFGSRMDLFLPADAEILVAEGTLTRGGQTPIARFPR